MPFQQELRQTDNAAQSLTTAQTTRLDCFHPIELRAAVDTSLPEKPARPIERKREVRPSPVPRRQPNFREQRNRRTAKTGGRGR